MLATCRYLPGQHFGRHYDENVQLSGGRSTRFTLLVYLNGQEADVSGQRLQGGNTVFYGAAHRLQASSNNTSPSSVRFVVAAGTPAFGWCCQTGLVPHGQIVSCR